MKNLLVIGVIILTLMSCCNNKDKEKSTTVMNTNDKKEITPQKESIHQFSVTDLHGEVFDFSTLKGKKVMIVNTASECGLTPQYEELQKIYDTYKDKDFVIVGFPANNFGLQEPGSDKEIATFCKENYGVTFPMMSKISVKGNDMHVVYQFLTEQAKSRDFGAEVIWNFQKYLIDKKGELVKVIAPKTLPTDTSIVSWIEGK